MIKLKSLLKEQPPQPPKKKSAEQNPPQGGGGEDTQKDLKINIPDTPFHPDAEQVVTQLDKILKQWQIKKYPSDEIRWKEYYRDILKLVAKFKEDTAEEE